jgi:hypothetical protein
MVPGKSKNTISARSGPEARRKSAIAIKLAKIPNLWIWPVFCLCALVCHVRAFGTRQYPLTLSNMSKTTKAFRKQARTADRVAYHSDNTFMSRQMRTLAEAFRAQAEALKKKHKKKK